MKEAIVINIIGGPGVGKTTVASDLFSKLKRRGYEVENVSEFAKELIWEGRTAAFNDRLYMHAMQNHRLFQMKDKLDFIITDSPLLLTSVYNRYYLGDKQSEEYNNMIDNMVQVTWNLYHNVTYCIERETVYQNTGRRENEEEAHIIDGKIREYLKENRIDFEVFSVEEAADKILEEILRGETNYD